jgi:GNAT superfamily N-acetyltransferase
MAEAAVSAREGSLFMQCDELDSRALRDLPESFSARLCKRDELMDWKLMFAQGIYMDFVNSYYDKVYAQHEDEFFNRCTFVVDADDKPIATSGIWPAYGKINTLLGFFVLPEYQGRGIGRGLLSEVLKNACLPVYLHTHSIANTAVKLFSDFGFKLVTDIAVGYRENGLEAGLPYLKTVLPAKDYANLKFATANRDLLEAALMNDFAEF